ncbi:ATP-binding cassette domain-containing protein [Candidatus Mycosynbacter amalyticus]|uniref:ATP-binding cassette domain-containing protein n=1 Tax=Candidatus Mycosynbacter amalyticus TaxID=2665156 RepID=A0A857MP69_9BACT|nr:ABC transporter ATP-binding protein [Candidatus Mycosynbacter amalyticus]QHN43049.1 ATP-binding cassette domain-containing protein [Candidatus Mycosynbacter amalyticus]
MKLFSRTNSSTTKKTINIYKEELKEDKKQFIIATILVPMQHLLYVVLLPLIISFFTQSLITSSHNFTTPLLLIGFMALISLMAIIVGHFGYLALFKHEESMTTKLTERALTGLLRHSHSFFANNKVGALAGDVNTFSRSYMSIFDTIALQATSIVVNYTASLIIVAFIAPIMLPALILLTGFIIYDALRSYSARAEYRTERKELQSKLFGNFADILGNQTLVRMFGTSRQEIKNTVAQRRHIESIANQEIDILQRGAETRMGVLFSFQILTLLLCLVLITRDALSIAALIFIITYLGRVTGSLFAINGIIRGLEQAFLDAAKVTEILDQPPEIVDQPHAKKLEVSHGNISLNDVSFTYQDAKDRPVFKRVQLDIPAGQSVGLVGKSGGGKSTLTHLLLRYMDIGSGEISIDGHNIATVTQDSLRSHIAYVPQDPYLFHRSLSENIAYGKPDATEPEIRAAAEKAHAVEFIDNLPQGLDTIVGERGVKLSGGQRQRIAIARAILKDAPILVLDEATSALDSESEKLIQESLETLMRGRTSIVIAHRLSTIAKLDRIIVLEQGKIIEDGTHTELLNKRGIYAKLWKHQSGGFIEE